MTSNTGNQFSQCLCCTECQDKAKDFQKVVDLKNIGLVIYRHILEIHDIKLETDEADKVTKGTFIIQNTKDQEITPAQYIPEIEQNKISCPRCRKIFEHAQRLLHTIPNLDKNVVHGICEHCLMEQKSCYECEQVIQKFKSKSKELPENTKNFIKQWQSKVKHVFKSIDFDDTIEDSKLKKALTSSVLYDDRLLIKSPKQPRECHVKQLFLPQSLLANKTVTDDRIVCLEEGLTVGQPMASTHLKEKHLRILDSIPPISISSNEKLLEDSFEQTGSKECLTRPKSSYYKNITKPNDMDQLFGEAHKRNREDSLRKYHSDESLLTIAEVISKGGVKMRKDYSYFFPKKEKYVYPKRFASSSELIKETQDVLQEKAETERKKREMKVLQKINIHAKKNKAHTETKAYPGGILEDNKKSSKEPHGRKDGTFRQLSSPIRQHGSPLIREESQSSSVTMKGVYKKDDKSHKIKDIASKTADLDINKGETTHIVKGEKYAKGDTSKGKTGYGKTDRQKDIRENQKLQEKNEKEKSKIEYEEKMRQGKEQKHSEKEKPKKEYEGKVRQGKEQKYREKGERGKVDELPPKEQRQIDKEEREQSGKLKVDERAPKEQRQRDKEEREKLGKGKVGERPNKEQKQKEDKVRSPGQQREVEQKTKDKKGEEKQMETNKILKEKKETADKSTETPIAKEKKQKHEDEKGDSKKDKEQELKQHKEKKVNEETTKEQAAEGVQRKTKDTISAKAQDGLLGLGQEKHKKEKETKQGEEQKNKDAAGQTTKQKDGILQRKQEQNDIKETTLKREEELTQDTKKIERDARETKETISSKTQEALLGLGEEKQKKERKQKEKYAAEPTTKQKVGNVHRDQEQKDIKEGTSKSEEELPQGRKKIDKVARENKETISAKAKEALLGKQQKEKDTKQEIDKKVKRESKSDTVKTASGKSKKYKSGKSPKIKMPMEDETETQSEADITRKSKNSKRHFDEPDKSEEHGLTFDTIKVRRPSPDDLILRLVSLKQRGLRVEKPNKLVALKALNTNNEYKLRQHKPHKSLNKKCIMCIQSDIEFDLDSLINGKTGPKFEEIIIGSKLYKYTPPFIGETTDAIKPSAIPLIFKSNFVQVEKVDYVTNVQPPLLTPPAEQALKPGDGGSKIPKNNGTLSKTKGKQTKQTESTELEASKGIIHYTLSDRSFIEKGWTMLPTEKVVRKINVYRMRPAQPEFNWFEHNKNKGRMTYDTGEILAEFDDNGRGRWFYRNGRLALDYYDAEELNASQRFVIWSSGEPDERGRSQPYTILATFDYLGNGIVFDHSGKIRLKYNQTEGIVLDRKIGPVSHWKWHTLNDPPVLQQVMIDTQMPHKDQNILKLGDVSDDKSRPDNDDMLAIEFDNFIKEKTKKLTQSFKPFQIKMKALKINENFSLRVMDQASVYLIYRDGTTNLKLNIGMILDHKEIVDTDTAEVGEVSNNLERFPARTDSLAGLQKSIAHAQCFERMRSARERRLRNPQAVASADRMTAAASRPLRPPLRSIPTDSSTTVTRTGFSCRKPTKTNIYYDNRLF